jgi:hypothetical protein
MMAGTRFAEVRSMSTRACIAALRFGALPILVAALSLATAACAPAPGSAAAGNPAATADSGAAQRFTDREEIEHVLSKANIGFELSDPDMFASAFAEDAVYELASDKPVFGYQKLRYEGRADVRTIITDRIERAKSTDPSTLSYDPASLRRYNRNSDELIEITSPTSARHISTWLVVMKTNVDIHMSAVGRYEDELVKHGGEWLIAKRRRIE